MEEQLSEILDNLLGLLLLEGSYEIEENEEAFSVFIDTQDAGRLIGARGESLESLQLIINQIISKKIGSENKNQFKRVFIDVSGWRKQKEEDLNIRAKEWIKQVLESGKDMEIEPMPAWQRRIVHMVVSEEDGVESESLGEGRDRHIMIKPVSQKTQKNSDESDKSEDQGV